MKVEAIALPYYGIGDFLTHLPFICALAKKNKESKFLILTKSRTFAKELLSFEKRIEVFYIENDHTIFSSIKEFFRLKDLFKKKKVSRIWIFHRSPRFAIIFASFAIPKYTGTHTELEKIFIIRSPFIYGYVVGAACSSIASIRKSSQAPKGQQ